MRRQLRAARDAIAPPSTGTRLGGNGTGRNGDEPVLSGLPASPGAPPPDPRPRLKKLRLALVFAGLGLLALVSWVFGIMMAVAQDLPQLENRQQYQHAQNSVVLDRHGEKIATLTSNEQRILVDSADISSTMKQAVVAVEDERFYEHRGIDVAAIGRAVVRDVIARDAVQGASTITQQFVKNALEAQQSRTIFQKLRESALAYHLERQWSKDKILTHYLNSIYFGEGAYGIESAARTYFGYAHKGCGGEGERCASRLLPHEAALLAAIISSPEANSPRANPEAATARRNLVLQKMVEQGALTQEQYEESITEPLPPPSKVKPPKEESEAPFFTSWLRQQVVDHYGAGQAFGGALQIYSTLDLELQRQAEEAVLTNVGAIAPTASVIVMDNATGGVLAMVGGEDYDARAFNLATNGRRQPGSAIKPFTLVTALEEGRSTNESFVSEPKSFEFKAKGIKEPQQFPVTNYEDSYAGTISLLDATTRSDNSVYAELGMSVGTKDIASTANEMGIETKLSTNPAMTLGGLKTGVTPLEMTHAYTTLARDGLRVSGTLASSAGGPLGISQVKDTDDDLVKTNAGLVGQNKVVTERAISTSSARTAKSVLETVVSDGTGTRAAYGGYAWGKTGTTEDNGDAWFCGGTEEITACVWVGHADGNVPMTTEYGGRPVDGGTIPALIWREIVLAYEALAAARGEDEDDAEDSETGEAPAPAPTPAPAPAPAAPAPEPAPAPEQPQPEAAPTPAEPAAPADEGGTATPTAGGAEG